VELNVYGTTVKIRVGWSHEYGFDISLVFTNGADTWATPTGGAKHFYSNNLKGALKRIKSAVSDMTPHCLSQKEKMDEEDAAKAINTAKRNELSNELGVDLKSQSYDKNVLEYAPSRDFHMSFQAKDNGNFNVRDIFLDVSKEDLMALVEIIKTSPIVMANRLKHGKTDR
jgi:hypothetical protein